MNINRFANDNLVITSLKKRLSRRILLIEDNRGDVFLLERMLRGVSPGVCFEFTDVPRMVDALEILDDNNFDLIFMDLNLLDIGGTAAIAALHAEAGEVPIIVYSGSDDPDQREKSLMCGARFYLVKGGDNLDSLKLIMSQIVPHHQINAGV